MLGTTLLARYHLTSQLGQGGMGTVYRAHDTLLDREVAVKVMSDASLGTTGRARLLTEAKSAAKLNHPHIVTVYDAGETEGSPFIVMELVEGRSLYHDRPQSLAEILAVTEQICAALDHAHGKGIIHRDLKLENVVVMSKTEARQPTKAETVQTVNDATVTFSVSRPSAWQVKLMDFGLARSADPAAPRLTEEGTLVGTFAYLAPELLMGQAGSVQSDLYALGVMLYELTTGQPPFTGDLAVVISQHLHAAPTPPRDRNPELSPELDALILKLLSKSPHDRPASAGDVAQALSQPASLLAEIIQARLAAPKTNLPTHLSKFVGREKEIAQLKRLLSPSPDRVLGGQERGAGGEVGARLVTLTGSGGIGKTRLSIQVASELLSEFSHGAWLVELAPLADPALVPQAVCTALNVQLQGNTSALTALTDYLSEKKLLLVLDNCEHLIDACAQMVESLLRAGPDLRLLTSSREALGVAGEHSYRVPSLGLPDPRGDALTIGEAESARLFVACAGAALPEFALTEANAPAIAQICRRLDGIALAIELAAARVKLLKVEQIAARLDDAFRFLTGGSRTALPRQQTLRATVDWSYNLLAADERALLRRLAVFAGGWTLEAAEVVCGDKPGSEGAGEQGGGSPAVLSESDILDLLSHLVDKSLVMVDREQGDEVRYRLLETVRQYAREKLAESGEGSALRDRHLDFFVMLAEQAEPEIRSHNQVEWLDRLDADLENLRAALEWGQERDVEKFARLASALWRYWLVRDYIGEASQQLTQALRLTDGHSTIVHTRLLARASFFYREQFNRELSFELAQNAIALAREVSDKFSLAFALYMDSSLNRFYFKRSDLARISFEQSLALCKEQENHWVRCFLLSQLSNETIDLNDLTLARFQIEQALLAARASGDRSIIEWQLNRLGIFALSGPQEMGVIIA